MDLLMDLCFRPYQNRARIEWASSWPSGSVYKPLRDAWGLEVSNRNDLLAPLASFLGFFFNSEMRHWINYVDYEGPPCSLRIIKKGYPSRELPNNFAFKCVSVSGHRSWLSAAGSHRAERSEQGRACLISSMMDEPISCPVFSAGLALHLRSHCLVAHSTVDYGKQSEEERETAWGTGLINFFFKGGVHGKVVTVVTAKVWPDHWADRPD